MAGDPDWGAIDALAARIRAEANAASIRSASTAEIVQALSEATLEMLDDVARMELMRCRLKQADPALPMPGIDNGVAIAVRRVQLLIEALRRTAAIEVTA